MWQKKRQEAGWVQTGKLIEEQMWVSLKSWRGIGQDLLPEQPQIQRNKSVLTVSIAGAPAGVTK